MPRMSIVTEHRLIRQTQSPERIADSTPSERLACWRWSRYDFVRMGIPLWREAVVNQPHFIIQTSGPSTAVQQIGILAIARSRGAVTGLVRGTVPE